MAATWLIAPAKQASGGYGFIRWTRSKRVPCLPRKHQTGMVLPVFPFWSADSQYVAFVAGTKLRKVNISNGSAQTICDVTRRLDTSGSWSRDGVILLGNEGVILRVSDAGGTPSALVAAHGAEERLGFFPVIP